MSQAEDIDKNGPDADAPGGARTPAAIRSIAARMSGDPGEGAEVRLKGLAQLAARRYASRTLSSQMICDTLRIAEFLILAAVSIAVLSFHDMPSRALVWRYGIASAFGAIAGIAGIQTFGGYEIGVLGKLSRHIMPVAGGWASALGAIALGFLLLDIRDATPWAWLALWSIGGFAALMLARGALGIFVRRWTREGRLERRVVIVGGGAVAEDVIRTLNAEPDTDIRICGIFDDRGDRRSPPLVAGHHKLGNIRELVEFMRQARVDMLVVTLPLSAEKRVLELMKSLWVIPADIRLIAPPARQPDTVVAPRADPARVQLLHVFDKPIAGWGAVAKRLFDIVLASGALVVFAPVMLMTALAIKLDSRGPVLFRQKRHGFNNEIIDILKFRSMFHEAADPRAEKVVTRHDPRVTAVGRFIRKSSIDELPQLWNVIRGELSLVGPRPHAVHARSSNNEAFIEIVDGYFGRHKVKPGITGLAQVSGYRGEIDQPDKLKKRFEHDLRYIDEWTLMLDLAILVRTPFSLLKTQNAY